jgi:lysophospholipase L1-like esterase
VALKKRAYYVALPVVLVLCFLPFSARLFRAPADVAFLGDSLTHGWFYPQVNFGIYGNTTAQMEARFPAEIQGRHFRSVIILGGTNDTLLKVDQAVTIQNLDHLAHIAEQTGAQPILCEIPPIFHSFNPQDHTDYSSAVDRLNAKIAQLAASRGWKLIDYYHPFLGHPRLSSDGVHLTRPGYAVMEWAFLREGPSS